MKNIDLLNTYKSKLNKSIKESVKKDSYINKSKKDFSNKVSKFDQKSEFIDSRINSIKHQIENK